MGRKDDIINRAGHNIDPRRIEQVVCKVPGIKDCLAFGIPDPKKNTIIICLIIEEEKCILIGSSYGKPVGRCLLRTRTHR